MPRQLEQVRCIHCYCSAGVLHYEVQAVPLIAVVYITRKRSKQPRFFPFCIYTYIIYIYFACDGRKVDSVHGRRSSHYATPDTILCQCCTSSSHFPVHFRKSWTHRGLRALALDRPPRDVQQLGANVGLLVHRQPSALVYRYVQKSHHGTAGLSL